MEAGRKENKRERKREREEGRERRKGGRARQNKTKNRPMSFLNIDVKILTKGGS